MLPAFVFEARPVIPIDDAVRVELDLLPESEHSPIQGKFVGAGQRDVLLRCTANVADGSRTTDF
jgi:hypothetical protein